MAFEDLMPTVLQWVTATEALAALGAEIAISQSGSAAPPEITAALRAVSTAAGIGDVSDLPPPQQALVASLIRLYLHQALDLLNDPSRAPGWTYTDPVILDGWGQGSTMVPALIATAHPELADVASLLDVGTGVGLLAVAAAGVWPAATIVGIDPWPASIERAHANVARAGLGDRVTLRQQSAVDLEDVDQYDCVWLPTFFLSEAHISEALPKIGRAMTPGGWIVLGRLRSLPSPLADATGTLRTIRGGGCDLDTKRLTELLDGIGSTEVHAVVPTGAVPLELVLGRRPD